jgi:hypothetical protein
MTKPVGERGIVMWDGHGLILQKTSKGVLKEIKATAANQTLTLAGSAPAPGKP